jgi:hypothetical protein
MLISMPKKGKEQPRLRSQRRPRPESRELDFGIDQAYADGTKADGIGR